MDEIPGNFRLNVITMDNQEMIYKALGRSGSTKILRYLVNNDARFCEIMTGTGLNPGILGRLIKELISIKAISYNAGYYGLTNFGVTAAEFGSSINVSVDERTSIFGKKKTSVKC